MHRSWTVASLFAAGLVVSPRIASAFTCSPTQDGRFSQVWMSRCIPYSISTSGMLFDGEERRLLIAQSFAHWAKSENPCTDLEFKDTGYVDELSGFSARPDDVLLQHNVIASIEREEDLDEFDDPRLLALTLTHFSIATGEILDADIILNAVRFRFEEVTDESSCRVTSMAFDLRNTLVHEIGHFIGFDHVIDEEATMFASAEPCERKKGTLADDDKDGICMVYPAGQGTRTCKPPPDYSPSGAIDPEPYRNQCDQRRGLMTQEPGGCSCTTSGDRGSAIGAFVLLFGIAALRLTGRRTSRPLRRS
jgi:MYXO-CTERM domain-containing protein